MGKLSFEEKGLLSILERIQEDGGSTEPTVRIALLRRGFIEPGEPATLTDLGMRIFAELRLRRQTAAVEFPAVRITRGDDNST